MSDETFPPMGPRPDVWTHPQEAHQFTVEETRRGKLALAYLDARDAGWPLAGITEEALQQLSARYGVDPDTLRPVVASRIRMAEMDAERARRAPILAQQGAEAEERQRAKDARRKQREAERLERMKAEQAARKAAEEAAQQKAAEEAEAKARYDALQIDTRNIGVPGTPGPMGAPKRRRKR